MNFIDLNKSDILNNSIVLDNNYREYTLGDKIEVTSMLKLDENGLVAKNLSTNFTEDKFMRKYSPTNKIYFSERFISSENEGNFASYHIDTESCRVFIGASDEFEENSGVLVFSGFISINNMLESDRAILCNDRVVNTFKKRVKLLAVGVRDDKLFGLYLVPNQRGISVGLETSEKFGISTVSLKVVNCEGYNKFKIDDWFKGAKIIVGGAE